MTAKAYCAHCYGEVDALTGMAVAGGAGREHRHREQLALKYRELILSRVAGPVTDTEALASWFAEQSQSMSDIERGTFIASAIWLLLERIEQMQTKQEALS